MPSMSKNVRGDERGAASEPAPLIIEDFCEKTFQKFANISFFSYLCSCYV